MKLQTVFPGVYRFSSLLVTQNLIDGHPVYGERIHSIDGHQFREWIAHRSKLGAAIKKGLHVFPFHSGSKVLYLGSAEGTTASHISDIIGKEGLLVGIDISPRAMHKFMAVCQERPNMLPLLADATQPDSFAQHLQGISFEVLFQDVAQPNQADIIIRNAKQFLSPGGFALLTIKARSIDSAGNPQQLIEEEIQPLKNTFHILQVLRLDPYEKDHALVALQKK
ncbi:MAG: fibrillarin-like rRNA/tRNA 2'-O-methyltransferase [Candidatus Diapherotrites archaeon]|nr:fibrillarin-like rRNA/tRNA 2'-O-methyltransferase [Candidatus Diapherotrites archaeon]